MTAPDAKLGDRPGGRQQVPYDEMISWVEQEVPARKADVRKPMPKVHEVFLLGAGTWLTGQFCDCPIPSSRGRCT